MFSLEIGPRFPRHRAGNRSSVSSNIRPRKSVPNLERGRGGPSLRPFAYKLNYAKFGWPARPYKSICYIAIASCPSPPAPIQNPKSKTAVWILDFGFWILDLGSWILDFGSWILDFGFWMVVVSILFVAAPNAAVWILDFGFWILDFGFWIFGSWILDFGFWILNFAHRLDFA